MALDKLGVDGMMRLKAQTLETATGKSQHANFGFGSIPALALSLGFGTGSGKANKFYFGKRTLAATTFDLIDLSGSLVDFTGTTIAFTKLKLAIVSLDVPGVSTSLRAGPQNQSNSFQGAFGGAGATVYKTILDWEFVVKETTAGYTVTAGTGDIFPVYNPGAASLDYYVLLVGE